MDPLQNSITLPWELILIIIRDTSDVQTLRQWRQTCQFVKRVVNVQLYEKYTISEIMLIQNNETSDLTTFVNPRMSFQPKAIFVKCLYLDWGLGYQREPGDNYVFDEDLVYALEMAIPAMPALTSIGHSGIIYQESLQQLMKAKSLQVLLLRDGKSLEECATWNDDLGERVLMARPSSNLKLDLSILSNLAGLRHLSIDNLLPGEGTGLGLAVKELHHLKNLKVMAARLKHFYYKESPAERGLTPLDDFFEAVFPDPYAWASRNTVLVSGFPKSLKNLSIIDR
ncbi:hypothetical protein MMC34_002579 [Xylographa carneopallida]|nr:hypothetical protein [Xylographa carneopallida]